MPTILQLLDVDENDDLYDDDGYKTKLYYKNGKICRYGITGFTPCTSENVFLRKYGMEIPLNVSYGIPTEIFDINIQRELEKMYQKRYMIPEFGGTKLRYKSRRSRSRSLKKKSKKNYKNKKGTKII